MLWTLIIGGIAGFIGSLLFKGTGSGIIINIVLGILGGYFFTAVIGAFLLCWIFSLFSKRA